MKLSIVTTLYKSSEYIDEFYKRISVEAQKITGKYEIIFVNDGSPDDSLSKVVSLYEKDKRVKVIDLSRNFGHHKAIMTGLSHAKGDYTFLIDSDLEEEPELLSEFWDEIQKDDSLSVVYGVQEKRKGSFFERISGEIFYTTYNLLSDVKVPRNLVTARLFKKEAKEMIVSYGEREICLGCIYYDIGFKQKAIKIKKLEHSETTYSLKQKLSVMVSSIVSFSNKPLVYIFNLGFIITFLSILYIIKLLFGKFVFDTVIDGWTSVIISIWFFGGLIILILGIIGIYLSKIFIEVKHRPYTIVKHIYEKKDT